MVARAALSDLLAQRCKTIASVSNVVATYRNPPLPNYTASPHLAAASEVDLLGVAVPAAQRVDALPIGGSSTLIKPSLSAGRERRLSDRQGGTFPICSGV